MFHLVNENIFNVCIEFNKIKMKVKNRQFTLAYYVFFYKKIKTQSQQTK